MRINVNIDDGLKLYAEQKAQSMGLSLSAFVRFLLARETEDLRKKVDRIVMKAEEEGYEPFSLDELRRDISNAKKA
ncbi:CopG family transcriptional regulator [Cysteiniphilum marinum]|uniref:CopG family transcriptional regulator n=1 Tax=Cysteiniphilum marinum TaxID=2774191 RepID=UPI00193C7D24|nr:CopG family transcriptional regulator [Cysteiniphilum marinum]